jgi:hypothetical protein
MISQDRADEKRRVLELTNAIHAGNPGRHRLERHRAGRRKLYR